MELVEFAKRIVKKNYIRRLLRKDCLQRAELSDEFSGLPPKLWGCDINRNGCLSIQGIDTVELARKYGTPLYIVDKNQLKKNYEDFIGAFQRYLPMVQLATSYKTNPLPAVLSVLHDMGTFAEVISHFELWLALKLGVEPERIIVNGPGKGKDCIELAVAQGVKLINIDGREEIPWLAEAAKRENRCQEVGLRLVTSVGWKGQFGTSIDSNESMETFQELKRHPNLKPCALHLHLGTGIKDPDMYFKAISEVLDFAENLRQSLNIKITTFDFGGGFGVPTVKSPDAWDLRMPDFGYAPRMPIPSECPKADVYAKKILKIFKKIHNDFSNIPPQVIFEPGRAITSSAQILLLSVITVKRSRGMITKLILDGGKNITMPLGYEIHQIFPANKMLDKISGSFDVYGPLCHPGDVVARCKDLPDLQIGDVIAIMDAGAYFIPNQMNFSHPRPSVVMVEGNNIEEIRQRESFADIVKLDPIVSKRCICE